MKMTWNLGIDRVVDTWQPTFMQDNGLPESFLTVLIGFGSLFSLVSGSAHMFGISFRARCRIQSSRIRV